MKGRLAIAARMGVLLVLASGCAREGSDPGPVPATKAAGLEAAPTIRVHADNDQLVFRYYDAAKGAIVTAQGSDAVPEEVRPAVVVMDLSVAASVPPQVLYVADLTQTQDDGTHPWRVVDRYAHARATQERHAAGARERASAPKLTLYSTEWCGVCKQARSWLQSQGIPFVERDLEKDPRALASLQKAARAAGMAPAAVAGSVPILVVGGRILKGFDPKAVLAALQGG